MRASFLTALSGGVVLVLGTAVPAQLTDLQPGRNFPTASTAFGADRTENIDIGDVDNDGDYDIVVANGGDGAAQDNRIYINQGGMQAGTEGTFADGTGARFTGLPTDTSRDCEFADFDNDADLDIYISNRGTTVNGGEVSRAYINRGGVQKNTIGFFNDGTDTFWGNLVSVPAGDEVGVQDGMGPWKDFSCDCDFADIDDDGDIDLFHSSYGPNIGGNRDSRVFLNDGLGVFDELWPWANAGADIQIHTLDIDLFDMDDDLDIDVFASSRDSQARVYRNNLSNGIWTGSPFTDVTQSALIATGATLNGSANYEAEYADIDGDGDFDVWAKNYSNFTDRILRNNGNLTFTSMSQWIKGDPNVDENEIDFLDYDGDGDLDAFGANFSGTNWIYQASLAQGITGNSGYYHRTGTGLSAQTETPASNNGGQTLDGEAADLDGDGDHDLVLANDSNQPNRLWLNTLGVPDTHAPTFHQLTVQGDKSDGSDTVIHAQVRDNAPYYLVGYYVANLIYTVDGGQERCVRMFSQGGQQFRGVIPGGVTGQIVYRVEVTDDAGNSTVSGNTSYNQSGGGSVLWQSLSCGTSGTKGQVYFDAFGPQLFGQRVYLNLYNARPSSLAVLFVAVSSNPVPFKFDKLYPFPINLTLSGTTDPSGQRFLKPFWPDTATFPSGLELWWQWGVADPAVPAAGATLSNAVKSTVP